MLEQTLRKDLFISGGRKTKKTKKPDKKSQKTIYFDNNGTTLICPRAKKTSLRWLSCYNASSDAKIASTARNLLKSSKNYIHKHCETGGDDKYRVLFTSGATESNCAIIRMIVEAFDRNRSEMPHIITSEYEHHSTLACLHQLEDDEKAKVTYIKPSIYGVISPKSVKKAINKNTCLVSIMWANNELGTCNNIRELAKVTHEASTGKFRIPFHTDAVQMFGKHQFPLRGKDKNGMQDIDALSMSFHKLYGPKHSGLLIIKKDVVDGFDLKAIISGSQQYGLRGGTEDLPGIAGSIEALKHTFSGRTAKNKHLMKLKILLLELLAKNFNFISYAEYLHIESEPESKHESIELKRKPNKKTKGKKTKGKRAKGKKTKSSSANAEPTDNIELILLGHPDHKRKVLPSTVLLSIIKHKGKPFCNVKFKKALGRENIVVSISSTCLTDQKTSSHVMDAISAPKKVKNGVIRISFGDSNTEAEVRRFVSVFTKLLKPKRRQ